MRSQAESHPDLALRPPFWVMYVLTCQLGVSVLRGRRAQSKAGDAGGSERPQFLSFLIPICAVIHTGSHPAPGKPHKCSPVPHLLQIRDLAWLWPGDTQSRDGTGDRWEPLGKGVCCIWSRLTARTLRVSLGGSFLAEQDPASSGSWGAGGAEPARAPGGSREAWHHHLLVGQHGVWIPEP